MIQTLSTAMQLFKGSNFGGWISNLIRLSQIMVQCMYFIISEFCYMFFKVECKRSYIFQSSSNETLIIDI